MLLMDVFFFGGEVECIVLLKTGCSLSGKKLIPSSVSGAMLASGMVIQMTQMTILLTFSPHS